MNLDSGEPPPNPLSSPGPLLPIVPTTTKGPLENVAAATFVDTGEMGRKKKKSMQPSGAKNKLLGRLPLLWGLRG